MVDTNFNLDKLPQYKSAFDNLRTSINSLNTSINELEKSQIKYNKQNQETITWGTKIKNTVKELVDTYDTAEKAIGIASTAFKGWTGIASAAFTLITTYGPQVLDFLSNMFQSDKTRAAAQALREYKVIMENFIDNVSPKLSEVDMLVNLAKNSKSEETRIEAIKQLNQLSPTHLNNLTLANIKTSEGKKIIDEYTNSLKRKAMEESVQDERQKLVNRQLTTKNEVEAAQKKVDGYKKGTVKDKMVREQGGFATGAGVFMPRYTWASENAKKDLEKKQSDYAYFTREIAKKDNQLAKDLLQFAPAKQTISTKATSQSHDKAYWENEIQKQLTMLNKLDAGLKDFESKAKPIKARIESVNKILSLYSLGGAPKKDDETPKISAEELKQAALKKLQLTADNFNKQLEQQHNNYAVEQASLKDLLDKKLITQEEYFEQWQQLQDKYHNDIGETIKLFNERDLAKAQQHQRDLVEAQQQEQLNQDKKAINKAFLPADKLEAEKKYITDKYDFEIQKAAETGRDTAAIRDQYQKEITAAAQKHEEDRKAFALDAAQQVSGAAFSILQNNIRSQSDAKIKELETEKDAELSNKSLTATQKKAIEDKYRKKEGEEKVKAFKAEQRVSILQAVINGALAVTKATAQTGVLAAFAIPAIIASTAIQVATIAAQKPPKYAKGGLHYQSDGKGALLSGYSRTDNTNAYLRSGEAIVVSEAMRNPWARNLVSAINVAYGGRDFSMTNPGRGYAIGGIFSDGGNSNRYYNQPMNDQKDLANTLAYQMINNFPPVYVDVKDINTQQNIMAQTINRVNL